MSSNRIESRGAGRAIGALALVAALVCGATPAAASDARSSIEDRRRFVSVTEKLGQAPLKIGLAADREWALEWLTDAPDVTVTICPDALGGLVGSNYLHAGEIILQNSFSMAAFLIEHPEAANDPNAQQLAGLEGALKAYRSILRDAPDAKSAALERLVQTQSRGQLSDFVRKAWRRCSKK
ncbi:MAG TPA: hypothetical protein VF782_13575 [Allosphingosinicella sp.]|jgi:hypothetical protein